MDFFILFLSIDLVYEEIIAVDSLDWRSVLKVARVELIKSDAQILFCDPVVHFFVVWVDSHSSFFGLQIIRLSAVVERHVTHTCAGIEIWSLEEAVRLVRKSCHRD